MATSLRVRGLPRGPGGRDGRRFSALGSKKEQRNCQGVRDETPRCLSGGRGRDAARRFAGRRRDACGLHQELREPGRARRAGGRRCGRESQRLHGVSLHPDLARQRPAADVPGRRGDRAEARRHRLHAGRHQGDGAGGAEDQRRRYSAGQCRRPADRWIERRVRRHRRFQHRARHRAHAAQGDGRQGQRDRARGARHHSDRCWPAARLPRGAEGIPRRQGRAVEERDVCAAGGERPAQGDAEAQLARRRSMACWRRTTPWRWARSRRSSSPRSRCR